MSDVPLIVWFIMYMSAGWVYMIHSPLTDKFRGDTKLILWVFWVIPFTWDILKAIGNILLKVFEGILEIFD